MNSINSGRVILGGLVAGLVLNVGEVLLNEVVFVKEMEEMARRLNIPRPGGGFIGIAVALTFLLGVVIVWVYAIFRSRLGSGPKTALIAALVAWFCIYFYSGILNSVLFGVPIKLVVMGMAWGLIEYALAGLAGAWLYKET